MWCTIQRDVRVSVVFTRLSEKTISPSVSYDTRFLCIDQNINIIFHIDTDQYQQWSDPHETRRSMLSLHTERTSEGLAIYSWFRGFIAHTPGRFHVGRFSVALTKYLCNFIWMCVWFSLSRSWALHLGVSLLFVKPCVSRCTQVLKIVHFKRRTRNNGICLYNEI